MATPATVGACAVTAAAVTPAVAAAVVAAPVVVAAAAVVAAVTDPAETPSPNKPASRGSCAAARLACWPLSSACRPSAFSFPSLTWRDRNDSTSGASSLSSDVALPEIGRAHV